MRIDASPSHIDTNAAHPAVDAEEVLKMDLYLENGKFLTPGGPDSPEVGCSYSGVSPESPFGPGRPGVPGGPRTHEINHRNGNTKICFVSHNCK